MRYFDVHLHLPAPDLLGLDRLRWHLDSQSELAGGLLVLNTPREVEFVHAHLEKLPPQLLPLPYYDPSADFPAEMTQSGWYKIHPDLHRLQPESIAPLVEQLVASRPRPRGLMVHCYPWGPNLQANISLPLVIALAQALGDTPILATHGGGYQSWAFRAHTGSLPNVLYDFSVSLAYFRGSDLLRPLGVYARTRPARLLFGSDWPSADPTEQLEECVRLGQEAGVSAQELEAIFLNNARTHWPGGFASLEREVTDAPALQTGKE